MKKRILNVGCGSDNYGTDFIDLYPSRKEVIKHELEKKKIPFKNNTFDEVRMHFIFEHLRNIDFVLKEIYRVLRPNGILDLKTDNASYWYHSLNNTTHTGRYEKNQGFGEKDIHLGLFTDLHLKNHLKDKKFRDIKIKYSYNKAKGKNLSLKGKIVLLINFILTKIRPIRRMGYSELCVIAKK